MAVKEVILHIPSEQWTYPQGALHVLHNQKIDVIKLGDQLTHYQHRLEQLGIKVHLIETQPDEDSRYNLMYCRDLFWCHDKGIILGNMYPDIRKKEPELAVPLLKKIKPVHQIFGDQDTFEGADALMLGKEVLIGVGHRTNLSAAKKIQSFLEHSCHLLPCTHRQTQHLLGALQVLSPKKVAIRGEIIDQAIIQFLQRLGIEIISIPENDEVKTKQAMNFVVLDDNQILMAADCPETKNLLESNNVEICGEMDISELIKGGGGLACLTGII